MGIEFECVVPTLRMLSVEKAKEFYVDFLGFKIDWEHRFEENTPLFMQVSRGGVFFWLSEHVGDGIPGAHITIKMKGIDEYHRELVAKNYKYYRPSVEPRDWGVRIMTVIDPVGARIHFSEDIVK